MRKVIHRYFDFEEMSRRSLARAWRKRTPNEKAEFIELFSYFMERNYASTLESYTNEKVVLGKETSDAEFARVNTVIITTDKKEVAIVYRLHKVGGEWRVYDVVVEGVSLIKNYRDQFPLHHPENFLRQPRENPPGQARRGLVGSPAAGGLPGTRGSGYLRFTSA